MTHRSVLNENADTALDGAGNGTLRMRPFGGGETWLPAAVSVKCSTNATEAQCKVYVGPTATDPYFLDSTLSGSTGDSTDRVKGLQVDTHGSYLWAVWTGGDPGAIATMTVTGHREVP